MSSAPLCCLLFLHSVNMLTQVLKYTSVLHQNNVLTAWTPLQTQGQPLYSLKFIDDSLQAGALQPMEKYLCANPQVRPVGSSVPSKGTRTAFTPEDDEILSAWVKKHTQI